jgi:hypothetical protein
MYERVALVSFAKPRSNQSQLLGRCVTFPLLAEYYPARRPGWQPLTKRSQCLSPYVTGQSLILLAMKRSRPWLFSVHKLRLLAPASRLRLTRWLTHNGHAGGGTSIKD